MDTFYLNTGFDIVLGDFYVEISKTEKRILRVTRKTLPDNVEYMFIEILKKDKDDEYIKLQGFKMTRDEFEAVVKIFSKQTRKCLCCSNCITTKDIIEMISIKHENMIAEIKNIFQMAEDEKVVADMRNFFLTSADETTDEELQ